MSRPPVPTDDEVLTLARSLLFVPGDDERKIARASDGLGADAVIVDLEDAVAASRKDLARDRLGETLAQLGEVVRLVRLNGPETGRCAADLDAAVAAGADGVVVPKVESPATLVEIDRVLSGSTSTVVPLVESAVAVTRITELAGASARVEMLALGAGDLVTDLGLPAAAHDDDGGIVDLVRGALVIASRAAGLRPPIDSPELRVRDDDRFRARCERARLRGFAGILCIHPRQVPIANEVFSPTADEVAHAGAVVTAFDELEQSGSAAITVDGVFVDYPIAAAARRVLAQHDLIEQRAGIGRGHP